MTGQVPTQIGISVANALQAAKKNQDGFGTALSDCSEITMAPGPSGMPTPTVDLNCVNKHNMELQTQLLLKQLSDLQDKQNQR